MPPVRAISTRVVPRTGQLVRAIKSAQMTEQTFQSGGTAEGHNYAFSQTSPASLGCANGASDCQRTISSNCNQSRILILFFQNLIKASSRFEFDHDFEERSIRSDSKMASSASSDLPFYQVDIKLIIIDHH